MIVEKAALALGCQDLSNEVRRSWVWKTVEVALGLRIYSILLNARARR